MPAASYILLIAAALGAGLLNSVAGGGSFLTFPALVFTGVPSIIANASSTVALFPGVFASAWAYRGDFKEFQRVPLAPALLASIAGGVTGAALLLHTSQRMFDDVIPWLLLMATLAFTFGPRLSRMIRRKLFISRKTLVALQFVIGIYGGYFGGAVGIIMLALWALAGVSNIHAMNAGRTLLGGSMNAAAVILFISAGKVWWLQTLIMLVAAVAGGYTGARFARVLNPAKVRLIAVLISITVTVAFFFR